MSTLSRYLEVICCPIKLGLRLDRHAWSADDIQRRNERVPHVLGGVEISGDCLLAIKPVPLHPFEFVA